MRLLFIALVLAPFFSNAQLINTFAGNGIMGYTGDGLPATDAEMNGPGGLAFDRAGNTYLADYYNNVIRKISAAGVITTIAGTGTAGYTGDDVPAIGAQINGPLQLAADTAGNMYIPDRYNNRIRKISTSGIITTVAGNGSTGYGSDGVAATATEIFGPTGVAVDAEGNLYIADYSNYRIRKVSTLGIITTVAGNGTPGDVGDGGMATDAEIYHTWGVTVDGSGNLYLSDQGNNKIREVTTSGTIINIAGTGVPGFSGDGGMATDATLNNPSATAIDAAGNIYISDQVNNRVRMVSAAGIMSTFSGNGVAGYNGDDIPAFTAEINYTNALAINPSGHLLICDNNNSRVRIISNCINDITSDPVADTAVSGTSAVFTVATSAVSPVFQWQEDPGTGFVDLANVWPYSGVTTNALTIHNASMFLNSTNYRCVISSSSSCTDTSSSAVLIIRGNAGIEQYSQNQISIYPNPAQDQIFVEISGNSNSGCLQLINETGQILMQQNITDGANHINIGSFPDGIYFLRLQNDAGVVYKRMIKS